MPLKVSKIKFLQMLMYNEEGLTNLELAAKMGISEQHFYYLRNKWTADIRDASIQLARQYAVQEVLNLRKNALSGDTPASKILLEMAEAYVNKSEIRADLSMGIIQVPEGVPIGAPVPLQIDDKSSVEDEKNGN